MKITYDKKVDAINVEFRTGTVKKTLEISPEILLDVDKDGAPLYLEILGASEKVGIKNFSKVSIGGRLISLNRN